MQMTDRQKVAHLLRRFGLGATQAELDEYEKLGVKGAFEKLIHYDNSEENFPISPWEHVFQERGNVDSSPPRFAANWALRMSMTKRPAQEKLTLFWHNHFAVSASKVQNGPSMGLYVETLRRYANGNFRTLLGAITKEPAMLRWLDMDLSVKGRPNENFAREVMELFTMGIGTYAEKDVQEAARALTGWSLRSTLRGGKPEDVKNQLMEMIRNDVPVIASSYSEGLHDNKPKTILGKTDTYDTEGLLNLLVSRPETARYICTKLWSFFAYPNPEPKVIERLMKVYFDGKYEIKPILQAIVTSKEFWSEKAVHQMVKSPIDFSIGFLRQIGATKAVLKLRKENAPPWTPLPGQVAGAGNQIFNLMRRQGLALLYPPDVAGWSWGDAWITSAMMMERIRFANQVVNNATSAIFAENLRTRIKNTKPTPSTAAVVEMILEAFDAVDIPLEKKKVLAEAFQRAGGLSTLEPKTNFTRPLQTMARLLFAMPEYQMC